MEFSSINYSKIDSSNSNASIKRKHEHDPQEEFNSQKRIHLIDNSTTIQTQQQQQQHLFSLPSPPLYKVTDTPLTSFQLSPNATANRANIVLSPATPPEDDIVMMEDELTDEDELLKTPSAAAVRYIAYDVGSDLDQGGFIGSLERGWSEMFNEMY